MPIPGGGDKSRAPQPSHSQQPSSPKSPSSTPAKTRLTNEQKKKNHIESEKKRRDAIRAGFDRLADVVPNMQGQGRSEAVVLQHTVAFMKGMIAKREAIDRIAHANGWTPERARAVYLKAEQEVKSGQHGEIDAAKNTMAARNSQK
jgi:hypothetical protein